MWLAWPGEAYPDLAMLGLAVALDLTLPELPTALHPVAWMGRLVKVAEHIAPAEGRLRHFIIGVVAAALVPAVFAAAAWAAAVWLHGLGDAAYVGAGAVMLKTTFSIRGLGSAALAVARSLEERDTDKARRGLRSLVSRDTGSLSDSLVASAAVESVAENTADSFLGPWLSFVIAGLPGAFATER